MNYNPKIESISSQDISLKNRKDLEITGVKKLISLNQEEFIVDTVLGFMIVRGYNLEMKQLDIEKGILSIIGDVYLIEYQESAKTKKNKSFVSKLFKWCTHSMNSW